MKIRAPHTQGLNLYTPNPNNGVKMEMKWPWAKKPAIEETAMNLNEAQILALDHALPGFAKAQMSEKMHMLDNLIPGFTGDPSSLADRLSVKGDELSNFHVVAAYGAIYSRVSSKRREIIKEVEKTRRFYLVDVILNQITEDALAPDVSSGDILHAWSDDETIDREIQSLNDKFDFDELVGDITPDMLANGEYILKTEIEKKLKEDPDRSQGGLTDIMDNVVQHKVIAVTKSGKIEKYVVEHDAKITIAEPADYIKFTLGSQKIRVSVNSEINPKLVSNPDVKKQLEKLPRYVRVGKSCIFPVIAKIRELELLEQLVPAAKLSKLSSGTLIGVQMPSGTEISKAVDATRKIESLINKKIGIDTTKNELTLESILSTAGRVKVVPLMGDKGRLEKLDYKSDEPDDLLGSIEDIRRVILTSVGIPYEIVFGGDEGNKGEILKRYARYLRKLKSVQKAISDGIRQLISIHLANKGIAFKKDDIMIEFRNKLIEIDNLDRLEFADTTINFLETQKDFVFKLADTDESPYHSAVDLKEYLNILHEQLKTIGLGSVLDPEAFIDTEVDPGDAADDNDEPTKEPEEEEPTPPPPPPEPTPPDAGPPSSAVTVPGGQ